MRGPAECTACNARRYRWVKKRIERTEVVAHDAAAATVVYSAGTLYGEWPDGAPFGAIATSTAMSCATA